MCSSNAYCSKHISPVYLEIKMTLNKCIIFQGTHVCIDTHCQSKLNLWLESALLVASSLKLSKAESQLHAGCLYNENIVVIRKHVMLPTCCDMVSWSSLAFWDATLALASAMRCCCFCSSLQLLAGTTLAYNAFISSLTCLYTVSNSDLKCNI